MVTDVYLVDDADTKFNQFDGFVKFLNANFGPAKFRRGMMVKDGRRIKHTSFLSRDVSQLIQVLESPQSLVLVDVLMADCWEAADAILSRFPSIKKRALDIGRRLDENAIPARSIPRQYRLCASVIALGEEKGARVAVVSTETVWPASEAARTLGPPQIGWVAANWPSQMATLRDLVNQRIFSFLDEPRSIWNDMHRDTNEGPRLRGKRGQWFRPNGAGSEVLFPLLGDGHHISDYLDNAKIMSRNGRGLEAATTSFERTICRLNNSAERIAVLKSTNRNQQLPRFVVERILGIKETRDLAQAVSWNDKGYDAAAVCVGLREMGKLKAPFQFKVSEDEGQVLLKATVQGKKKVIDDVSTSLSGNTAIRARERLGYPGDLNLAFKVVPHGKPERKAGTLEIVSTFNEARL